MTHERLLAQALAQYPFALRRTVLLGHSDKLVYRVDARSGASYTLSIYLPEAGQDALGPIGWTGGRAAIQAEMALLEALRPSNLGTARPVRNCVGEWVSTVEDDGCARYATALTFVEGTPLNDRAADYPRQAFDAGLAAAELHRAFGAFTRPDAFAPQRQAYLEEVLARLNRGVASGQVSPAQMAVLAQGGELIRRRMDAMDAGGQRGLVHTDLRCANFILQPGRVVPIDFGRCMDGYPLYDLGEMCAHMGGSDPRVQAQILRGYGRLCPLSAEDLRSIEAMFVLFIMSVVAEFVLLKQNRDYVGDTLAALTQRHIPGLLRGALFAPEVRAAIGV